MAVRSLDELNEMSMPPEQYFEGMELSKSQKEERIKYTERTYEAILSAMYLIDAYMSYGNVDYEAVKIKLGDDLARIVAEFILLDDYLKLYLSDFAQNFIDSTKRNIDKEWYLSEDRALFNAENSANDALNYKEYIRAVKNGKTHKKWLTAMDTKVRLSHLEVENTVLPIAEYFVVGDTLMRFPKDCDMAVGSPQEIVNCRCSIKYFSM